MALANMVRNAEDSLICDLAETYHIFSMRNYPARMIATLAAGLRADSRTFMKLSGQKCPQEILLIAAAVDRLSLLVYAQTKDAKTGRNRPQSLVDRLTKETKEKVTGFSSPDAFEKRRAQILKEIRNGK